MGILDSADDRRIPDVRSEDEMALAIGRLREAFGPKVGILVEHDGHHDDDGIAVNVWPTSGSISEWARLVSAFDEGAVHEPDSAVPWVELGQLDGRTVRLYLARDRSTGVR